ncbi:type III pantothenate kinase, partial [uncultured Novosphingobium sp.]
MLLAIDAGNTNVVFALFDGRAMKGRWRIATDPRRTGDQYAVWLLQLLQIQGFSREAINRIIISTVVPRALHNLEMLAQNYFGIEPLIAGQAEADYGIDIDVDEPRSLGADRAVNAVAAHAK